MQYILILFLIFIDLFTNFIAQNNLLIQKNLVGNFLFLKYIENTGVAFSIPITWYFLKILTILFIWVIFWYYLTKERKKQNWLIDLSFAFILGWAIWNWYERIFENRVIDFIWVKYFAIFNLADIFIMIWVLIYLFFYNKRLWK